MSKRIQQTIVDKVKENILKNKLLEENDTIVIGVSGGPDSIFLLHVICELNCEKKLSLDIHVAHVNHMIRKEAIDDENLVVQTCQKYKITPHILRAEVVKIARENKISLEECGRNVRYDFFEQVCKTVGAKKTFVAHNMNDNVETFLMNLIRGAGINGLTGMDVVSNNIYRPILDVCKANILEFLNTNNIPYALDKTNFENEYTRNKIRNELIKTLQEYNPNIINTINKTSKIIKQNEQLVDEYVMQQQKNIKVKKNDKSIILNRKIMSAMSYALKCELVRKTIFELIGNLQGIEQIHVMDIVKLLNTGVNGKKYILGEKFVVEISKTNVIFSKN